MRKRTSAAMKGRAWYGMAIVLLSATGCGTEMDSPVGPSAVRPTPAGGAPLVTFLGNAAACGSASSSDESGAVTEAEARVLGSTVGTREVVVPGLDNRCASPIEMSNLTLLMYETADRTGEPVLTSVSSREATTIGGQDRADGGCGGCGCGVSQIVFLEHNIGPFPADLDPLLASSRK